MLNKGFNFIATVFTRLFQFIAVPTIALAVITTLSELGTKKNTGKIFARTITYTLLTTFSAAIVSLILYISFTPDNITISVIGQKTSEVSTNGFSYYEHLLSIVPNNILQPLISGNVLSVILIAAAAGIGLSYAPQTENRLALIKILYGMQELLFTLIRALIWALPIGIMAFAAQLTSQIASGTVISALGKYTAIVIGGNLIQIFIIIPLFLLAHKLNPIQIFKKMSSALTVAFFTKSSITASIFFLIVYLISNFGLWAAFMLVVAQFKKVYIENLKLQNMKRITVLKNFMSMKTWAQLKV